MADILKLPLITTNDLDAGEMLLAIAEDKPKHAFVIIWPEDGSELTYHCSTQDMPVVLMRLREFEHKFFNEEFNNL